MLITTTSKPLYNFQKDLQNIDDAKSLKRSKLTKANHSEVYLILKDLIAFGSSTTMCESVKNYCEKFKLQIEPDGIGWKISL